MAGVDSNKDQSYFLCQLNQKQLSKALFPIGELTKPQVREIAREQGLATAEKKDSQGLCFIGKVSLPEFLKQQLAPKEGKIIEIFDTFSQYHKELPEFASKEEELEFLASKIKYSSSDGKEIGTHQGAHYYTIGQSKGLGIGGHKESCFIISRDMESNTLFVGMGKEFPGLYQKVIKVVDSDVHWIRKDLQLKMGETMEVQARIRYRQPLENAVLHQTEKGLYVAFENPQSAVAEGQFVAWYQGEELLGSGVIS